MAKLSYRLEVKNRSLWGLLTAMGRRGKLWALEGPASCLGVVTGCVRTYKLTALGSSGLCASLQAQLRFCVCFF